MSYAIGVWKFKPGTIILHNKTKLKHKIISIKRRRDGVHLYKMHKQGIIGTDSLGKAIVGNLVFSANYKWVDINFSISIKQKLQKL